MTDLFDLTGTTTVVTGSSRGIGYAIARTLLRQSASVVANSFDAREAQDAARTLSEQIGDATRGLPLAGDVTDPATTTGLIDAALQAFGRVDHLICNAGIDIIEPAIDYTPDEWDRVLTVTLRGAFQSSRCGDARSPMPRGRGRKREGQR